MRRICTGCTPAHARLTRVSLPNVEVYWRPRVSRVLRIVHIESHPLFRALQRSSTAAARAIMPPKRRLPLTHGPVRDESSTDTDTDTGAGERTPPVTAKRRRKVVADSDDDDECEVEQHSGGGSGGGSGSGDGSGGGSGGGGGSGSGSGYQGGIERYIDDCKEESPVRDVGDGMHDDFANDSEDDSEDDSDGEPDDDFEDDEDVRLDTVTLGVVVSQLRLLFGVLRMVATATPGEWWAVYVLRCPDRPGGDTCGGSPSMPPAHYYDGHLLVCALASSHLVNAPIPCKMFGTRVVSAARSGKPGDLITLKCHILSKDFAKNVPGAFGGCEKLWIHFGAGKDTEEFTVMSGDHSYSETHHFLEPDGAGSADAPDDDYWSVSSIRMSHKLSMPTSSLLDQLRRITIRDKRATLIIELMEICATERRLRKQERCVLRLATDINGVVQELSFVYRKDLAYEHGPDDEHASTCVLWQLDNRHNEFPGTTRKKCRTLATFAVDTTLIFAMLQEFSAESVCNIYLRDGNTPPVFEVCTSDPTSASHAMVPMCTLFAATKDLSVMQMDSASRMWVTRPEPYAHQSTSTKDILHAPDRDEDRIVQLCPVFVHGVVPSRVYKDDDDGTGAGCQAGGHRADEES